MSAKNLFIEPSDVWLFRTGRPFAADEQTRAASIFPPTPRTMQGALRSAYLAQKGVSFTNQTTWPREIGSPDCFGDLQARGPLIARRGTDGVVSPLFPLPLDIIKLKNSWQILSPCSDDRRHFAANLENGLLPLLPLDDTGSTKFNGGWLDDSDFLAYLRNESFPIDKNPIAEEMLFGRESRFGVQIDSHPKRPTEGMLYQVEYVRLHQDVGLLVEVDGISLQENGLLQLGGEARAGRFETVTANLTFPTQDRLKDKNKPLLFKLYLATPAIFGHGWLPEHIDKKNLMGRWREIELTLVSAAIGKPQPIGGRDISKRDSQRDIYGAVPAGSVYFFETQASADDVFRAFDGQCVSDVAAQIGFGLGYVGGWENV